MQIQSVFFWNNVEKKRHINWVAWSSTCKSKLEEGLGVQSCNCFNAALLGKWDWRFIPNRTNIWFPLLSFKYDDDIKGQILVPFWSDNSKRSSIWLRDLRVSLGIRGGEANWFVQG